MIDTRITRLLGIRHPIIQAGMTDVSFGELAAAVSNAGALGTVASSMGVKGFREELIKAKSLTAKPLSVNFPHIVLREWKEREMWEAVDIAVKEGVEIATMSSGDPKILLPTLKEADMVTLQVGATVRHAVKAQEAGVDIFIANGAEAGGGASRQQIGNLALVPQVVDRLDIPVVMGGAVTDSRALVSALALGAEGIYVGTRFIATTESGASQEHIKAVLLAADDSTSVDDNYSGRGFTREFMDRYFPGIDYPFSVGQGAGLVNEVLSAKEVVDGFLSGVGEVMARLESKWVRAKDLKSPHISS